MKLHTQLIPSFPARTRSRCNQSEHLCEPHHEWPFDAAGKKEGGREGGREGEREERERGERGERETHGRKATAKLSALRRRRRRKRRQLCQKSMAFDDDGDAPNEMNGKVAAAIRTSLLLLYAFVYEYATFLLLGRLKNCFGFWKSHGILRS